MGGGSPVIPGDGGPAARSLCTKMPGGGKGRRANREIGWAFAFLLGHKIFLDVGFKQEGIEHGIDVRFFFVR